MTNGALQLNRLTVSNYKSIKQIELDNVGNFTVLMGQNNAGKSNLLDGLIFLRDASHGFAEAILCHGGNPAALLHKKREQEVAEIRLEFLLPEDWRRDWLVRLFARNRSMTPQNVAETPFLRTVTLQVRFGHDWFSEELSTPNVRAGARACTIFQVRGSADRFEQAAGQLETVCERCYDEIPHEMVSLSGSEPKATVKRLCLGKPDGAERYPISQEIGARVCQPLAELEWIGPARNLVTRARIEGQSDLRSDAANLPDVLHWLHNNKPKLFPEVERELTRLVPRLGRLYTPTSQHDTTLGLIEGADEDLAFTMDQMSFGTRSAIAIITKVVLVKPGSWVCIEEPETHLHPEAQVQLFQFLQNQAREKRLFVATHSTAIAAATPLESLIIVERDVSHCTVLRAVEAVNAPRVIQQLGIHASLDIAADAMVFVEEAADVPLLEAWAGKYAFHARVQFFHAEQADTLRFLANARIALSKHVHTSVYTLLNGATLPTEVQRVGRTRLINHLKLPADHVVTFEAKDLHGALLDAHAIARAFPGAGMTEADLEGVLVNCRQQPDPKTALEDVARTLGLERNTGVWMARIAQNMAAVPAHISEFFAQIDADCQPFWTV